MNDFRQIGITTKDNPYDVFDDFKNWYYYDMQQGYNTCGKLARFLKKDSYSSPEEEDEDILQAINRLIQIDFEDKYKIVTR